MIYIVLPVEDASKGFLADAIQGLGFPTCKEYAPDIFFVDFKGTSRELCEKLGIGEPGEIRGLVIPFSGFYGYASTDLWQWVKANG